LLVSGKTKICGIIGYPIEHSLSPMMQNAAFRKLGLDYAYVPFSVVPRLLGEAVRGLGSLGVVGFNVTVPHKVRIIKYLHRLDSVASNIGAVNTVVNDGSRLVGYNTDASGAIEALRQGGIHSDKSDFTIMGAGGAARAITFALAGGALDIKVLNRTLRKAEELRRDLRKKTGREIQVGRLTRKNVVDAISETDILINATSIGMKGGKGRLPIRESDLRSGLTVFDVVYSKHGTDLLRMASHCGCNTISGFEMLLHQGVAAFEIWTGTKAPIQAMRDALTQDAPKG